MCTDSRRLLSADLRLLNMRHVIDASGKLIQFSKLGMARSPTAR